MGVCAHPAAVVVLVGATGREATARGNTNQGNAARLESLPPNPLFLSKEETPFGVLPERKKRERPETGATDAATGAATRNPLSKEKTYLKKEGPYTGNR
ncbi:hypothetical protein [Pandoravirus japonicus]|uniref:Uncharacterized protein n=1 Tax=Pandoravirus japonicus TaxID=2823154 RepID=A0A811BRU2_9VIRU|nr:hypothetical protein [Pandoravirus japonicus]